MKKQNRFNLVDEPWIPIAGKGRVSLKQLFSNPSHRALGGNPIQKIALIKLLLAIVQAACTPSDDNDWATLKTTGMAQKCLDYLYKWRDSFWLYGEKPFLQMPVIVSLLQRRTSKGINTNSNSINLDNKAIVKPIGPGFYPDIPSDNNTVLTQAQAERSLSDAEKAIFIVTLMNFALGGKRVEKGLDPLTPNYVGKSVSAKAGPSLGNHNGYLHSFLTGSTLLDTLWLNVLTMEKIEGNEVWTQSVGVPPWELMPHGEACDVAKKLKNSYMGCLIAMSRFVLLDEDGIYYVEGIQYPSHKNGWCEPSMAVNRNGEFIKLIWTDPDKRPWRELASLLTFINATSQQGYDCWQIRFGLLRANSQNKAVGIWSGGLKVRNNSGDQSVKQDDDFVESEIQLPSAENLEDSGEWLEQFKSEMSELDVLARKIYDATLGYFKVQNMKDAKQAKLARSLYWQLCERHSQALLNACTDVNKVQMMRKKFAQCARKAYDSFCPKNTARQLDAWAQYRPNLSVYLNKK